MNAFLERYFSGFCSQDAAHTFFSGCRHMYLCARCSGIYFGAFIFFLGTLIVRKRQNKQMLYFLFFLLINIIHAVLQRLLHWQYSLHTVFILGHLTGYYFAGAAAEFAFSGRMEKHKLYADLAFNAAGIFAFLFILHFLKAMTVLNIICASALFACILLLIFGLVKRTRWPLWAVILLSLAASAGFMAGVHKLLGR